MEIKEYKLMGTIITLLGVIFLFIGIGGMLGFPSLFEPIEYETNRVDCFDNYGNQILGETCLEKVMITNNDFAQLFILFIFSFIIGIFLIPLGQYYVIVKGDDTYL